MKEIINIFIFIGWVAGIVLAKGFWSTIFSIFIPFWAWYLVIEKIMQILKVT
jgi:hypothetical protein